MKYTGQFLRAPNSYPIKKLNICNCSIPLSVDLDTISCRHYDLSFHKVQSLNTPYNSAEWASAWVG